jgi:HK97 gp10 family phage protein
MPRSATAISRTGTAGIMADLEIDGDAFMRSLIAAVAAIEVRSESALWVFALRVQNTARILAPVDTGRLRASIMATRGKDGTGPFVDIGTNVEYAGYVEFGTRFQVAQPYLRPAIAKEVPGLAALVAAG